MVKSVFDDGQKDWDSAKDISRGVPAPVGFYPEIEITGIKEIVCTKKKCNAIVVEFDILQSTVPEVVASPENRARGFSQVMMDRHLSFWNNVRRVIASLMGAPFKDTQMAHAAAACNPDVQPLVGTRASLRCSPSSTPIQGTENDPVPKYFTQHDYRMISLSPKLRAMAEAARAAAEQK